MKGRLPLAALSLFLFTGLTHAIDIPAQAAAQVSSSELASYVRGLSGADPITVGSNSCTLATRYSTKDDAYTAAAWIHQGFSGFGLSTSYHDVSSYPSYSDDVVAEIRGLVWPERVFVICAHYDSTSSDPDHAPGADDDASGSAAVLEVAKVLSSYAFKSTVRFIAFSGEEQGLCGSYDYARDVYNSGTDIRGVLNLDMIAYTGGRVEDIDVMYRYDGGSALGLAAQALAQSYRGNFVLYSGLDDSRIKLHADDIGGSDHVSFRERGYPAILAAEATAFEVWGGSNPYYHFTNDVFANLDMAFATAVTRASAATLADWAGPIPIPTTPGDFDGDGSVGYSDYKLLIASWGGRFGSDNWNPFIDLDSDGVIGLGDYRLLAGHYGGPGSVPPVPGDANGDDRIDGGDLALWQQNYDPLGLDNHTFAGGDFNGDGKVDGGDLALWQENYNPLGIAGMSAGGGMPLMDTTNLNAIPEPATAALLAMGAAGVFLRRRFIHHQGKSHRGNGKGNCEKG